VNAYEVKAGMVFIAGKLCDPCLSALKWSVYHARRYTRALLYLINCVLINFMNRLLFKDIY